MVYVKYIPKDQKNSSQRMAEANAANLANPETNIDDISHDSQISQGDEEREAVRHLKKYIDELEQFSFHSREHTPPKPPFSEPPERAEAWAAWWAAIDRRNRKFKVGRWEPVVSHEKSTELVASPDGESEQISHDMPPDSSVPLPEQLNLMEIA